MTLYILLSIFWCAFGFLLGLLAAFYIGFRYNQKYPVSPATVIDSEIIAEVLAEQMALEQMQQRIQKAKSA